jgi:arylsulfatase A-like enzyme
LQRGIVGKWGAPLISADRLTLPKMLKQSGYRTACIGKWHLGWNWPIGPKDRPFLAPRFKPGAEATDAHRAAWRRVFSQAIEGGPTARGFDHYFGTDVPNWPPYCFIEDNRTVGIPSEFLAARLLGNNMASLQGPALPGWELEPILPTLGDRAAEYIDASSEADEPYFLYMPLTSPHTPLAVNERWQGESGLNRYADFVMETDAVVGQVLEAIENSGAADRTLVLFTSDNGCAPYIGAAELEAQGHYPSGPLRGYKSDVWEGGHRVAFIVRWPGRVQPGSVCDRLVHQADVMATFAEIAGQALPADAGEDSFSLLPLLKGEDKQLRPSAVSQSARGLLAVRRGPWKLIFGKGSGGWTKGHDDQPAQLYNLDDDLGEKENLYAERPELVTQLNQLMQNLVQRGRSTEAPEQSNDVPVRWKPAGQ